MTTALEVPLNSPRRLAGRIFNVIGPLLGLILVFALFSYLVKGGTFYGPENIRDMIRQTAIVWIAALGMTVVIISGGIDLSVASVWALTSIVIAYVLKRYAIKDENDDLVLPAAYAIAGPLVAVLCGMIVAAAVGFFNGALITSLRVVPFIITLGAMRIYRGAGERLAENTTIYAPPSWLNDLIAKLPPEKSWMLFPEGVWLAVILSFLVVGLLHYTRFGRHVFAIGSNEQTARLCGVPVVRTKILVYMLMGLFAAIAGTMQFSRTGTGDPTAADGKELDVIAAVVIGGASLNGGAGSITGTIIGAFIMTMIATGCNQLDSITIHLSWIHLPDLKYVVNPADQKIIIGSIIIIAVALDRFRRGRMT